MNPPALFPTIPPAMIVVSQTAMAIPTRGILFDMDGTLTRTLLDFPAIKREMGIGDRPILEALAQMNPDERAAAEIILHRHEDYAAANATLNDGCEELLHWLAARHIRTAIVTRNRLSCAQTVLARYGLSFDVLITRENGRFKPDPSGILEACRRLELEPHQVWMVGDGQYDIEAGLAAGTPTVWLSHAKTRPFAACPAYTVANLHELTALLRDCLTGREEPT
jgi:HAD superfamily hydrolase (TIGR01509 family)